MWGRINFPAWTSLLVPYQPYLLLLWSFRPRGLISFCTLSENRWQGPRKVEQEEMHWFSRRGSMCVVFIDSTCLRLLEMNDTNKNWWENWKTRFMRLCQVEILDDLVFLSLSCTTWQTDGELGWNKWRQSLKMVSNQTSTSGEIEKLKTKVN